MTIVHFGEVLLRLSPPGYTRLAQSRTLEMHFGGAEANVAVCVAQLGKSLPIRSVLISAVPDHSLGDAAEQFFRASGVETSFIRCADQRLGLYFVENGAAVRPSQVIYDRRHSAIAALQPGDIHWDEVFYGASWFHCTGITAALGDDVYQHLITACRTAKHLGLTVSCDLNYRQKLWTPSEARKSMVPLMEYVDVCISNEYDAGICLGVEIPKTGSPESFSGTAAEEATVHLAQKLQDSFGFQSVALSVRSGASISQSIPPGFIVKRALLLDNKACSGGCFSKSYTYQPIEHIGGGDAFTGGLIYGLLTEQQSSMALEIGVATSVLKQTMPGDSVHLNLVEVRQLMESSSFRPLIR